MTIDSSGMSGARRSLVPSALYVTPTECSRRPRSTFRWNLVDAGDVSQLVSRSM